MNEVRFIQKIGQVSMETLVENAAQQGFVLAGSPTLISHVPAQLMVYVGVNAKQPEYRMVAKTGQLKISHQISDLLNEGWHIYGSMLTGELPMQAMVRGDIGVHKMFGMDGSGPSDGADWGPAITAARDEAIRASNGYTDTVFKQADEQMQNFGDQIDDIKEDFNKNLQREVNMINEAGEVLDKRVKDNAQHLELLESAIGELVVKNSKEHDDIYTYVEQTRSTLESDMRGNAIGCNGYTDEQVKALADKTESDISITQDMMVDIANGVEMRCMAADEKLDAEIKMETAERIKDIADLNARIDQLTRIMAQIVDQPVS